MNAALYTRKQSFCKNVKFGLVALAFQMEAVLMLVLFLILFLENRRSKPVLITQCKVFCRPAHVSIKNWGKENSSGAKKDRLEHVKSHWKGSEIYRFSRCAIQIFLSPPTMVVDIFQDLKPLFKKFLAMPLCVHNPVKHLRWSVFIN